MYLWSDETAYMPASFIKTIVVPMYCVAMVALIMVSTLATLWNHFTELLKLVEQLETEGTPMMLVYQKTYVCKRCLSEGLQSTLKCRHKLRETPFWKDTSKQEVAKILMACDASVILAESRNIVTDNRNYVFNPRYLKNLEGRELFQPPKNCCPGALFLIIDPNSGGDSETAIGLLAEFAGRLVVRMLLLVSLSLSPACFLIL